MALNIGSIDVSDPNNVTGSGLAFEMFTEALSGVSAENKAAIAVGMKPYLEGLARAIINHVKNNAVVVVVVHTTDSGIQRLPATFVANADTQGPSADKSLNGTVT